MAINGHEGNEQVVSQNKLLIGIDKFKVIAINPNMEQLVSIGINAQKEPEYLGVDKNSSPFTRIDIWLQGEKQTRPIKFTTFARNENESFKEGTKTKYINNFGSTATCGVDEQPNYDWFKMVGVRKAYIGEEQLIKFLRAWVNSAATEEVFLETWPDIFRGNVKELRDVLANPKFADNKVRAMMWVRESADGKYFQEVAPIHFTPAYVTAVTGWTKSLKNYTPKGVTYSYDIKEFQPNVPTPDEESTVNTVEAKSEWA
jgi:hypothetical protein